MELTHGGDIYSHKGKHKRLIDFSANINPLGIPKEVEKAVCNSILDCTAYPDPLCRELKQAVALNIGTEKENLIFGNGAADVIFRLITAIKPKKALLPAPTFAEYQLALNTVDCKIEYYPLLEQNEFAPKEDILSYIKEDTDIVFICNPNNPTGVITPKELMVKILKRCKETGTILVADECFNDFLDQKQENTLLEYIDSYKNLFILRAFTKIYAIPGIRLGFGICSDKNLLEKVYKSGQAWSVSTLAQAAGIACLKENKYLLETAEYIKQEREFLKQSLTDLGFLVYGSNANYIFFKNTFKKDIKQYLEQDGILIRSCGNYNGLDNCYYRIAVKTKEENRIIIDKLTEIIL